MSEPIIKEQISMKRLIADIKKLYGLGCGKNKLPLDFKTDLSPYMTLYSLYGERDLGTFPIVVETATSQGIRRVFVKCTCGRLIPPSNLKQR